MAGSLFLTTLTVNVHTRDVSHGTYAALVAPSGHEDREPVGADWIVSGQLAVASGGHGAGSGDCRTDLARLADIELVYLNAATTADSIAETLRVGVADNRTRDH
jgi:hypothetical protein